MTEQTEPEDTCRPVDIDGETIRVRGAGELTEQGREFTAEIVRAAKRKFEAEPPAVQLRQEIAEALRNVEAGRWRIRAQTDAVMAVVEPHANLDVLERAVHRARRAETALGRIAALADKHPVGIDTALIHEALATAEPAADDGPSVREAAADDRAHWTQKYAGE